MTNWTPGGLATITQPQLSQLSPADFLKWQQGLFTTVQTTTGGVGGPPDVGGWTPQPQPGGGVVTFRFSEIRRGWPELLYRAVQAMATRFGTTGLFGRLPQSAQQAIIRIAPHVGTATAVVFIDDIVGGVSGNGNGPQIGNGTGDDDMTSVPALPFDLDFGNGYLPQPVVQKLLLAKKLPPDPPEARWLADINFWWVANGVLFGKLEHGGRIVYEWDNMRWRRLARQPKRVSVGPGGAKNARATAKAAEWILKEIAQNKKIYDKFTRRAAPRKRRITVRESGPGNVVINE